MIDVARLLGADGRAFVVGGQAINLWAEHYATVADELNEFRPFTSKDIDFFGQRDVAERLARDLGGSIRVPAADDTTFQTAIVEANVGGIEIAIDFISHVLGVRRGLAEGVVDLEVPYASAGGTGTVLIRLMHPLHCLQSRIANIIRLQRTDDVARRQAEAAPVVLREFISDALRDGDHRAATDTLEALFRYLRSDLHGRDAHLHLRTDPIEVIRRFADDERLDARYRDHNVAAMLKSLARRRSRLGRIVDAIIGTGGATNEEKT